MIGGSGLSKKYKQLNTETRKFIANNQASTANNQASTYTSFPKRINGLQHTNNNFSKKKLKNNRLK